MAQWINARRHRSKKIPNLQEKKLLVAQAFHEDEWIRELAIVATASIDHLIEFVQLWANIQRVHLWVDVEDDITWKLIGNGYSAASTYKLQFFGLVESGLNKIVWKAWAMPKAKNHAWLSLLDYGQWIYCDDVVGTTVGLANFASNPRKIMTIFLFSAAST
jgi:hypothetical protein